MVVQLKYKTYNLLEKLFLCIFPKNIFIAENNHLDFKYSKINITKVSSE